MNLHQITNSEQADKQFVYRYYPRVLIFVSLVVNGLVTLTFAWLAVASKQVWLWFCVFVFFTIFFYYGWVALLDTRKKFVITVSQTGIHVPVIWRIGSSAYLPFSSLSAIELIEVRKGTILKFSIGKKIHVIFESFFPQRQDFKELVGIVQQRSSGQFSYDS